MKKSIHRLLFVALVLSTALATPASAREDPTEFSLEQLMALSISGASKYEQKQSEVAAAVSIIGRAEIKAHGWRTLSEALASLPGIYLTYDRQYSYLGTRGFGLPGDLNTRVLVTVNGNRINDVVFDAAPMERGLPLDMDLIERIEYTPGPGGAVYGQNALFGVVNVITRSGAMVDGAEAALAYHSLQQAAEGRVTWGKRLDNGLDVLLSASGYDARGQNLFFDYGHAGIAGVATGLDGETDQTFFARLARGPWFFDLSYGDRRKDDPTAGFFADPLVPGQYQRDRLLLSQLQYQDTLADDLQLTGRVFLGRQRYTGLFNYTSPYFNTGSSDWRGAELRLVATTFARHKLLVGLEYQDSTRVDQTVEDLNDPASKIVIPGTGWRAGLLLQDEWHFADTMSSTLGLRQDRNDVTGSALSPRAALIWQANAITTLKALYGRANRAPNAYEQKYDDGQSQIANPTLGGETIDTVELVLDHRWHPDLNLRGSIYHWEVQDLVTLGVVGNNLSQYQSGGDVRATGVELSFDKTWHSGDRMRGSLSWQNSAYKNGNGLDNAPRLLGKLNGSTRIANSAIRLGYELQYNSQRRAVDGSNLNDYWLANLKLSADRWSKGLEVSLGIFNLFDQNYQHPAADTNWQNALTQDGRSVRLKVDYKF